MAEIVLVLPGDGWLIEWQLTKEQQEDSPGGQSKYVDRVVAWAIDSEGHGFPLHTTDQGVVEPLAADNVRVFHPDQRYEY